MQDGGVPLFEWVKLLISLSTPIAVVAIGYFLNVRLRAIEDRRWRNQKVLEKRLALFEVLAPKLNDLYCYFTYVGHWKELEPPRIIALKRELDKEMHVFEALFPSQLHTDYDAFMETCFSTFGGSGQDARLCTGYGVRKQIAGDAWNSEWERKFVYGAKNDDVDHGVKDPKRKAYRSLMTSFAAALHVDDANNPRSGSTVVG